MDPARGETTMGHWIDDDMGIRYRWDDAAQGIEVQRACTSGAGFVDAATVDNAAAFAARQLTARDARRAGAPAWFCDAVTAAG
jgi:hypothetical protein